MVDLPEGKNVFPCKWVFDIKTDAVGNIIRRKARLVARGDKQQYGVDFQETYTPVAKFASLKVLLSLAARLDLEIDQDDFDFAFINGTLEEEIYMSQLEGFTKDKSKVFRLRRSIYGLCQAARTWYNTLDVLFRSFGFTRVKADYGVWV